MQLAYLLFPPMTDTQQNQEEITPEMNNDTESGNQATEPTNNPEQDEVTKLRDAVSRAQADYQNLLRRMERDREEMMWFITAGVVKKFLPHIDNLERALIAKQWDESDNWVNGIRSIVWGLEKTLADMKVSSFESLGQEVDANKHEVMSQTKGELWKIVFEFEKWYTLNDKVLRHAKVVTGNWEKEENV